MNPDARARPRRSCLYMPGANARALAKAATLPADSLVLDLEDAVAPEAKVEAREAVAAAVAAGGYGHREVIVRINGLDTPWGRDDLAAAVAAGPHGILAPKVSSAQHIEELDAALDELGATRDLLLWAMIETPAAILRIEGIAAASARTRLAGLVVGTNDLAKELNAQPTPDRAAFQVHLALTLAAARAHGLVAIDGVFNDIGDDQGLRAECRQGRVLGFDGKSLIHPAQLQAANEVFSPDPEAVAHARAVIEAFARPENRGKGVIRVDGRMTELLHLEQARQLAETADRIARLAELASGGEPA